MIISIRSKLNSIEIIIDMSNNSIQNLSERFEIILTVLFMLAGGVLGYFYSPRNIPISKINYIVMMAVFGLVIGFTLASIITSSLKKFTNRKKK